MVVLPRGRVVRRFIAKEHGLLGRIESPFDLTSLPHLAKHVILGLSEESTQPARELGNDGAGHST